jgi:RHH-type proline utilization regulon transcriptional repressor/proline dehydrogenase/delta 1-pyrroline-5-carboxylate dehydrogenase
MRIDAGGQRGGKKGDVVECGGWLGLRNYRHLTRVGITAGRWLGSKWLPWVWDHSLVAGAYMDSDFCASDLTRIEQATQSLGRELLRHVARGRPRVWQRRYWDDRLMAWSMCDESVKVAMFRFVDVLPMLDDDRALVDHLRQYLLPVRRHLPWTLRLGLALARPGNWVGGVLAYFARRGVTDNARRFIAGTTIEQVLAAAQRERTQNRTFTIDLLGEAVTSEVEAEHYFQRYLGLIRGIGPVAASWPEVPLLDRGASGPLPRTNVSVKLSALDSQFDAIDPEGTSERVAARLRPLLRAARENGAFVNIDMESYATKDLTLAIFKQVLMEDEFRDFADAGIVVQCYLVDADRDLYDLCEWAKLRGTPVGVRIVKGAYWDYETVHAQAMDWPIPVFQQKSQSDAAFERGARFLIRNYEHLRPAIASHNVRSLAHAIAAAECAGVPREALEIQMLYGMGDAIQHALAQREYRVRVYMPYGELIPGMAYLVRRLLENTSNDSFLVASRHDTPAEKLLVDPAEIIHDNRVLAS